MSINIIESPITPASDRLIVIRLEPKKQTASGLYIPDDAREKPSYGVVIAAGKEIKQDFVAGSVLLFNRYAGVEQELSGVVFLILRENEILGTIRDKQLIENLENV